MLTVYRHAAYDTPWWANANRSAGRYHALGDPPVQYWCTHPLGPSAEFLRWQGPIGEPELADLRLRLWSARVDRVGLTTIDFGNAKTHGITPEELVGDDYAPTQALARRVRDSGGGGLIAPSAALPGTAIVVLFGPRLLFPYLLEPVDQEQVPTAHVMDGSVPPEVIDSVRWRATSHQALNRWRQDGEILLFRDPPVR